jgi:hypothetical protein
MDGMKKTVKLVYILALTAVAALIFVGHARIKIGKSIYFIDYACDMLIPLSSLLGMMFFRTRDRKLFIFNLLLLVFSLAAVLLYYTAGFYNAVFFAVLDFFTVGLSMYVLFAGKTEDR